VEKEALPTISAGEGKEAAKKPSDRSNSLIASLLKKGGKGKAALAHCEYAVEGKRGKSVWPWLLRPWIA